MDQHIPNEKELIRPRRLCLRRELPEPGAHNFACGANYHIPGWFNYACGANYPYRALKGGLFCICLESTNYPRGAVYVSYHVNCRLVR